MRLEAVLELLVVYLVVPGVVRLLLHRRHARRPQGCHILVTLGGTGHRIILLPSRRLYLGLWKQLTGLFEQVDLKEGVLFLQR